MSLIEYDAHGNGLFWCPGCRMCHFLDDRWTLTGMPDKPTATPSIKAISQHACHFWMRDGRLVYLGDCSHELAGKTVEMVDINEI